jgi:hypothetical protein
MGCRIATTTDTTGFYEFTGLRPGTYRVEFVAPAGYEFTWQNADGEGLDGARNSDADPETGKTVQFDVNAGDVFLDVDAGLVLVPPPVAAIEVQKLVGIASSEVSGDWEGLTPGFWRTHSALGPAPLAGWPETGYDPTEDYNTIFGVTVPGDPTLLDALCINGGGVNALMRHSAAALLNAAHPNIHYEYSEAEVLEMTRAAILSGDSALIESTKDLFDFANNRGADLTTGGSSGGGSSEVVFDDANTPGSGPSARWPIRFDSGS